MEIGNRTELGGSGGLPHDFRQVGTGRKQGRHHTGLPESGLRSARLAEDSLFV